MGRTGTDTALHRVYSVLLSWSQKPFPKIARVPHPPDTRCVRDKHSTAWESRLREGSGHFVTPAGRTWEPRKTSFSLSETVQEQLHQTHQGKSQSHPCTEVQPENHHSARPQALLGHTGLQVSSWRPFCLIPDKLQLRTMSTQPLRSAWSLGTPISNPISPGTSLPPLSVSPLLSLLTLGYDTDWALCLTALVCSFPNVFHGFKLLS